MTAIDTGVEAAGRSSTVQSVERAVEVLDALAASPRPQSALDISKRIGLHRTIVHRLLRTLASRQLVLDLGNGGYRLGAGLTELSASYIDTLALRRLALPHMVDLHAREMDGHAWHLSLTVPTRAHMVIIERVWSQSSPLDSLMAIPTALPLRKSAAGRAYLAALPDTVGRAAIGEDDHALLLAGLLTVRQQGGVAFARNEFIPGIDAIAVPIGPLAAPVGVLVLSGTELEAQLDPDSSMAHVLVRSARTITEALSVVGD